MMSCTRVDCIRMRCIWKGSSGCAGWLGLVYSCSASGWLFHERRRHAGFGDSQCLHFQQYCRKCRRLRIRSARDIMQYNLIVYHIVAVFHCHHCDQCNHTEMYLQLFFFLLITSVWMENGSLSSVSVLIFCTTSAGFPSKIAIFVEGFWTNKNK